MLISKLSKTNYSQTIVIPKEYRMQGDKVKITPYGNGVLIEPLVKNPFEAMFNKLDQLPSDFMSKDDSRPNDLPQKRDEIFT